MTRAWAFGILFVGASPAAAQPAGVDVRVAVDVDVGPPAPPPPPPPAPHRFLELTHEWTARTGETIRLEATVARGAVHEHAEDNSAWSRITTIAASRTTEDTPYYGHADRILAQDTAITATFGGAARRSFFDARGGFGIGIEHTTGTQTDFSATHEVSRLAPVAELFAQLSFDLGPATGVLGCRVVGHAQRYETLDRMDSFTREPTLSAFVGIAAALD